MSVFLSEPAAEDNLLFNGEVEHLQSPKDDSEAESPQKTPPKKITELENSNPSPETPGDFQVCVFTVLLLMYLYC